MTIKEKLEEYDLFDQSIVRHGILACIRDYEIIGHLHGRDQFLKVQYVFKGCIKADYEVRVAPEHYSMDKRLLDLDRQNEPDFPKGFIWGANYSAVYPGWKFRQDTNELKDIERKYRLKFYEIFFETTAYNLKLIFHDIEIKVLERTKIEKNAL